MATLYVAEFAGMGFAAGSASPITLEPPLAEQTVAVGGGSTACTNAFKGSTTVIRLHTDLACSIAFGTAPTATTSTRRMAANQTEYFSVPVNQAYKVAVIAN